MTVGTLPKLTPHQRWALLLLARTVERAGIRFAPFSLDGDDRWADVKDTGSRAAMEHLARKGYAERRTDRGPRGGELLFYRLSARGRQMRDHIIRNGLKTRR